MCSSDLTGFQAVLRAVERGRTWVKLSAGFRLPSEQAALDCAAELLKSAGPERLLWGSDWPFAAFESSMNYQQAVDGLARWVPDPADRWQIQLSGPPDLTVPSDVYELDPGNGAGQTTVATIHDRGGHAVCYVSAGTREAWRRDAGRFPAAVVGRPDDGWPGERWLDIRRIDVLGPIMRDRLARCARLGYDAIDWDNVDGWSQRTGFPITRADQRRYDRFLARIAHRAGLAAVLKNDQAQAVALEPWIDAAVLEECVAYEECALAAPFLAAGKPVIDIEYAGEPATACTVGAALGIQVIRKRLALGPAIERC